MRVALVTPRYRPAIGGVEIHVERLAEGLAERGHEVEVLTQAPRGATDEERDGVRVRRFATVTGSEHYAFSPRLVSHLKHHADGYDVVHAHNYHALPALAASRAAVGNFVLTPHYHGVSDSAFRNLLHRPYRAAGRRMMRRASKIISVASTEAELLSRHFPQARAKITVIPNGVDGTAIDAAIPFECADKSVIFSAGRLERYKQVDLLVKAMVELEERYVLRIAGDGPARPELESLVDERELGERVKIMGQIERSELNRWFRTADVYVSMSKIEAMGISTLEALYAGARVVASDIPAHNEVAEIGNVPLTLLSENTSAPELAAAIAATSGEALPQPVGIPTWEQVVARTERAYEEVEPRRAPR